MTNAELANKLRQLWLELANKLRQLWLDDLLPTKEWDDIVRLAAQRLDDTVELRDTAIELVSAAEHDLNLNKNMEDGPPGYWSPRTEDAIAEMRAALAVGTKRWQP